MNEQGEAPPMVSFSKGTYVTLWPKVEKCHNYVSVLLAAQEQLQETVDRLIAGTFPCSLAWNGGSDLILTLCLDLCRIERRGTGRSAIAGRLC